jgi:dienelactone hydrolase
MLETSEGDVRCRYHEATSGEIAVLWLFGAAGGFNGPAGGAYTRLAERLAPRRIASLEVAYRRPGQFIESVLDVLVGIAYLESIGRTSVVLVGHSFGGAVAIAAGASSGNVIGVAALSSQTAGAASIYKLTPRPVLLIHGNADEILPARLSSDLYDHAKEPKQIILYEGAGHGLNECRAELDHDLFAWILAASAPVHNPT